MQQIRISVRDMIEYVMRAGDINAVFLSSKRMADGVKAHQKFQKQSGEDYEQEIPVKLQIEIDEVELLLTGRIDGVIHNEEGVTIDEIKSTSRNIDDIEEGSGIHFAQVNLYAYMYAKTYGLEIVKTRLTYIELELFKIKQFVVTRTFDELESFFYVVVTKYIRWAKTQQGFWELCKASILELQFPFQDYRRGQKSLMSGVYKTIEEGKILFSRAPTGIGKTIATLFPALKALAGGKSEKIFYLTAKNVGKQVALNTLKDLEGKGLCLKRVVITAKDKTCLMEERNCDPEYCMYAKGHFDRINLALEEMYLNHNHFDRETIEQYAILHRVCPYELSLDIAIFSQVVICDYNYVFDPTAMLKRFFQEESGEYTLLIDEAHNLVDRAREMYSASLDKTSVLDMKKKVKNLDARLYQYLTKLNKLMIELKKKAEDCKDGAYFEVGLPHEIEEILRGVIYRTEKIFSTHQQWPYMESLLDFYFKGFDFLKKMELYDERYITYYQREQQNLTVKMFCMDPSQNIKNAMKGMKGVVFFSATLIPMDYYIRLLGGDPSSYGLTLQSPFDEKKLCLLIERNISTKYVQRDQSIQPIIDTIEIITKAKKGNYMVFFPSYKYMETVYEQYKKCYNHETSDLILQERYLNDIQREEFLESFESERDKTLVAFVVLGGMFGEGIDLIGDRLSGAIVVTVGIPQICFERDLIKRYFDQIDENGYEIAYVYPGMNKVLQGAGRVIRSMEDVGVVVLIDQRFNSPYYKALFPEEWMHARTIHTLTEMEEALDTFWENQTK